MGPRGEVRSLASVRCDMPGCVQLAAEQWFGHHGIRYEISLCGFHAAVLDWLLEPFKASAREIPDYSAAEKGQ